MLVPWKEGKAVEDVFHMLERWTGPRSECIQSNTHSVYALRRAQRGRLHVPSET